jgi:hypothetical protein
MVRVSISKARDQYVVTYIESRELVVGEKLATSDGRKFTVGRRSRTRTCLCICS